MLRKLPLFQAIELERDPSRSELETELQRQKGASSRKRKDHSSTVSNVSPVAEWRPEGESPSSGNRDALGSRVGNLEVLMQSLVNMFAARFGAPPPGQAVQVATAAIAGESTTDSDGEDIPTEQNVMNSFSSINLKPALNINTVVRRKI